VAGGTDSLSRREAEVLDALAERLSNAEIAQRLVISVRTVESHVSALLRKLHASDRRVLAAMARQRFATSASLRIRTVPDATKFVGRDRELDEIAELFRHHRLVTITGPGGGGKTRLASEFRTRTGQTFCDGAYFVDLAPLRDPTMVWMAVASALQVRAEPGGSLADTVTGYLAPRAALVVLDNCEHVILAAAELADQLVGSASHVSLLATSREPLRVRPERVIALAPLAVPDRGEAPDAVDAAAAVQLFVDRAGAADRQFRLTSDNRRLVRDICARLDGLPLAIELAAARIAHLPLARLAASLDNCFVLLQDGARDMPERHRALRGTIDWSYQLLDDAERVVFERLSVFPGHFPLEAAEFVASAAPIAADDVVRHIANLVAKSLIVREAPAGEATYRLLEPIRQYASWRLASRGHADEAATRHLEFFVKAAERPGLGFRTAGTPAELDRLRGEESNFRAALAWALDDARPQVHTLGIRLVGALAWVWFIDGVIDEGCAWADRALKRTSPAVPQLRLLALYARAALATQRAELATMVELAVEMRQLAATAQHKAYEAFALDLEGNAYWALGKLAEGETLLADSVAVASSIGLRWHEAFALAELSRLVFDRGDLQRARELAERALSVAISAGEEMPAAFALDVLAVQALAHGDVAQATAHGEQALARYTRVGYREGVASATQLLAKTALEQRQVKLAHSRLTDVLDLHRRLGHRSGLASTLEASARLRVLVGHDTRAAILLGVAESLRLQAHAPVPPSERSTISRMRSALAQRVGTDFASMIDHGRSITVDAAVAIAGEPLR
jgi:non-specific serine/threonine protein kinase